MSTKNYTPRLILIMGIVLLIFCTPADAQRGRGHSYRYGHGYYHSPRIYSFPHPYVSIGFRGINYGYHRGYYYRPYSHYYRTFGPRFGFHSAILPPGYNRIYAGAYPYFYYDGTYYSPSERDGYHVVAPPLGAKVPQLPRDARAVVIDGQKYYELDGTYYREEINADNELWYTVVGVNGSLNTDNSGDTGDRIGDRVEKLPPDCKPVVISGKKYYESPSGIYYEEIISPNKVYYEVVGKPDE